MIKFFITASCLLLLANADGQYYIRGQVKDEKAQPLQNVKIYMHSTRMLYNTGMSGGFGITTSLLNDSLTFSLQGYETKTIRVKTNVYQEVVLKFSAGSSTIQKQKLLSFTKDQNQKIGSKWFVADESYSNLIENDFVKTTKFLNTTFAIRVDKASYSNIRRFINQNSLVPPYAVRIEEMLNYFNLNYKEPKDNQIFNIESQLTSCPWNTEHQLLFLNLSAKKLNLDKVPPGNFVFLIDVSGSMDAPNRLPLLKAGFQLLVKNLRDQDTVSIVIYGGSVGVWLQPTSGSEKQKIIKSIEELTPGGSTPGEAAIKTAYTLAKSTFNKKSNNRIILATDGDFNVGQVNEKELQEMVVAERQTGIYLTCLGVGMGNYKDSKIEALARNGNGNFAYIDDIKEAEKVLVTEFTQTLYTVANDVYLNIQFNPDAVDEYRLIGYDNKKGTSDERSVELQGGEIGSGNGVTAVFEIQPATYVSKNDLLNKGIGTVTLNYQRPEKNLPEKITYICPQNFKELDYICNDLKFATAVTMFGLILRQSKYLAEAQLSDLTVIAGEAINPQDYLENEFLALVEKAKKIYPRIKKRKGKKSKRTQMQTN
ncbi:MAG: von Willebrand factor type A domain-containing protein [Ginsengibacter sp.]